MKTKSKLREKIYRAVASNVVVKDKDGVIDLVKTDTLRVNQILQAFSEELGELEGKLKIYDLKSFNDSEHGARQWLNASGYNKATTEFKSAIKEMKDRL